MRWSGLGSDGAMGMELGRSFATVEPSTWDGFSPTLPPTTTLRYSVKRCSPSAWTMEEGRQARARAGAGARCKGVVRQGRGQTALVTAGNNSAQGGRQGGTGCREDQHMAACRGAPDKMAYLDGFRAQPVPTCLPSGLYRRAKRTAAAWSLRATASSKRRSVSSSSRDLTSSSTWGRSVKKEVATCRCLVLIMRGGGMMSSTDGEG